MSKKTRRASEAAAQGDGEKYLVESAREGREEEEVGGYFKPYDEAEAHNGAKKPAKKPSGATKKDEEEIIDVTDDETTDWVCGWLGELRRKDKLTPEEENVLLGLPVAESERVVKFRSDTEDEEDVKFQESRTVRYREDVDVTAVCATWDGIGDCPGCEGAPW